MILRRGRTASGLGEIVAQVRGKAIGGRPPKFSEERAAKIVESLRLGCTRKAAGECAGIGTTVFCEWMQAGRQSTTGKFAEFAKAVIHAEAECEARNAAIIQKAALGWNAGKTTTTRKTVFRTREIKHPDGSIVKEPVAFDEVTETKEEHREFDWRAALEWLKRRRSHDWGDSIKIQQLAREIAEETDADLLSALGYPGSVGVGS